MKEKGIKIIPSSTPMEIRDEAIKIGLDGKVTEFIDLYEEYRFSGKRMSGEDRVRYKNLMKEIKRQL
jgi:hypothetical protein